MNTIKFIGLLIQVLLAPATGLGLLLDVLLGNTTRAEAWEWIGDNEWFALSIVFYLLVLVGWIEVFW